MVATPSFFLGRVLPALGSGSHVLSQCVLGWIGTEHFLQTTEPVPPIAVSALLQEQLALAEYHRLGNEILKRIELRYGILGLALLAAGTLLTIGLQKDESGLALSIYPPLAAALFVSWCWGWFSILRIAKYLRERFECLVGGPYWERYLGEKEFPQYWLYDEAGQVGIFFTSELVLTLLYALKFNLSSISLAMMIVDVLSLLVTIAVLKQFFRYKR